MTRLTVPPGEHFPNDDPEHGNQQDKNNTTGEGRQGGVAGYDPEFGFELFHVRFCLRQADMIVFPIELDRRDLPTGQQRFFDRLVDCLGV